MIGLHHLHYGEELSEAIGHSTNQGEMTLTTTTNSTATNGSESCKTMMIRVMLSILSPLTNGGTVVNNFSLEANTPLEWFREHADELARTCMPDVNYTALNVAVIACEPDDDDQQNLIDRLNLLVAESQMLKGDKAFPARPGGPEMTQETARLAALNVEIYLLRNRLKYRFNWVHPELTDSNWML